MNKLIAIALIIGCSANAETYHKAKPSNEITKFEALQISIKNPNESLYRCNEVRITQKGTFKNVPNTGNNDFLVPVKK